MHNNEDGDDDVDNAQQQELAAAPLSSEINKYVCDVARRARPLFPLLHDARVIMNAAYFTN